VDSDAARFSMSDLVESSGLNERTIRYYISQGIVAPALGRGRSRYYTPHHLEQLERAAALRSRRLSIDEIRAQMQLTVQVAPEPTSGERWERVVLHPTLELHLHEDAPQAVRELARQVVALAHDWLGDDVGAGR
jgi:DNA-binding transcriptional MerR regulator